MIRLKGIEDTHSNETYASFLKRIELKGEKMRIGAISILKLNNDDL